jgi:hypothetical protein
MTYERPKPWAIVRLSPNQKWEIVDRYRTRSDADGHLQIFRLRFPKDYFEVVFDLPDPEN